MKIKITKFQEIYCFEYKVVLSAQFPGLYFSNKYTSKYGDLKTYYILLLKHNYEN